MSTESPVRFGDLYESKHTTYFLVLYPDRGNATLIDLESGIGVAQGKLEVLEQYIQTNGLQKVPRGSKITVSNEEVHNHLSSS